MTVCLWPRLFVFPVGLWLTWNAPVGATWPANPSRLPDVKNYEASNAGDFLHLSLAPPQAHHPYEEELTRCTSTDPCTDLSLGNQPVFTKFGKNVPTHASKTGINHQTGIDSCEAETATSSPSTIPSSATPSEHHAIRLPTDALTSVKKHQAFIPYNSSGGTRKFKPAAPFLDTSPGHLEVEGKIDNDAPSSSNYRSSIFPVLQNEGAGTLDESNLFQERLRTNYPGDHQTIGTQASPFHPKYYQNIPSLAWFEDIVSNSWRTPQQADIGKFIKNPALNEFTTASSLQVATPAHQSFEHVQIMPATRSSKRPRILFEGTTFPEAVGPLKVQATSKPGQTLTDTTHMQKALSIGTRSQFGSDKRAVNMGQKRMMLTEPFKFDADLFRRDQCGTKGDGEKIDKMISTIQSLQQGNQPKISKIETWEVPQIFRSCSRLGQLEECQRVYNLMSDSTHRRVHSSIECLDPRQTRWFEFWGGRTGIDLSRLNSLQAVTKGKPRDYYGRDFALLLLHIDMIGTILKEYCLHDPETGQDCGAKLIKKAIELFEASILEDSFRKHKFTTNLFEIPSSVHLRAKKPMPWVWECVQTLIYHSKEENLKEIFFLNGGYNIHDLTRSFFSNVFDFSIEGMIQILSRYSQKR
ncbi:hypothetical protein MJO29_009870 [Puccinia striiformis f. sp. tritici]|nr:hypothetical protein MJO29_009870 [Puccinia striiformis f. sp. tritici]